ncbi:MAG: glycoside hydrolase family 38 N-terminal domain-containing protein [Acidimicrobiia bacterium]
MPEARRPSTARPTTVAIVPHTHWDREWYSPFQAFRLRLVALLDELLPLLERDLSYARFLLDGQTAVLDDYLEVRPEAAEPLRRLATSGRLAVGPWMILMDEFMVSGETIVRDLQLGMARATELGGAMPVGYLPDMFGHVAQMPQLLRQAGLEHAVVWRGVPAAVTRTAFWWEAPDGSRVRAEYLYGSYSNGRDLPDDAKQLVTRAHGYELELGHAQLPGGGMLLMNGTDHQAPQPWLGRVVAEANAVQDDYRFVVTSLPEYLADQPTADLTTWTGELRSGARANVLMGVASNRVDVHQVCAAAERALERRAEPMSALLLAPDRYPHALLGIAWRRLVLNSAHDSSCACSADEVVDAVVVRYQEARQIGDGLARQALHALAADIDAPAGSTVVVNPTGVDRGGIITVNVPGDGATHFAALDDGTPCPTQIVRTVGGEGFARSVVGQKVRWVLESMHGPEFAGSRIGRYELARHDHAVDVDCFGVVANEPAIDLEELREELLTLAEQEITFNIRVHTPPVREAIVAVPPTPGLGWRTLGPVSGEGPASGVSGAGRRLANEHLRVEVDARDGTWSIETDDGPRVEGLGRLVDGGDGGDTYNYSPPTEDLVVDRPESVTIHALESGPVRARVLVESTYRWPERAIGDMMSCSRRSEGTVDVVVRTTLELRAGEPFLRVRTELDNQCRDHRLRAHFPLPARVDHSDAECAFTVVSRGLTTEGGPHETPLPTFVSRRFVDASSGSLSEGGVGLAVLHDGLLEYEVVADGRELALTLLRATGYLSRADIALRPNPAGPLDPLEGPQLQRDLVVEYALLPHRGIWEDADLHARADEVLVPLERVRGGGVHGARRAPTGRPLRVDGAVISAVLREPGGLVLRVYNPSTESSVVHVEREGAPATGWVTDLLGRPQEQLQAELELGPNRIATLRLD